MMIRALEWSDRHVQAHQPWYTWAAKTPGLINKDTPTGDALRKKIHDYLTVSGSECTSRGVELDSRYSSPVIYQDRDGTKEHEWDHYNYVPSTWPGGRAPHVFLKNGGAVPESLREPGSCRIASNDVMWSEESTGNTAG
jgi:FAD-dependent monooxygenase